MSSNTIGAWVSANDNLSCSPVTQKIMNSLALQHKIEVKPYTWLLFDADDTLFDFNTFEGLKRLFSLFGKTLEVDAFANYQELNKDLLSEEVGTAKPQRGIFEHALKAMGHPESTQVLMIGDRLETDILGGRGAGFKTAWLNAHHKIAPKAIQADYELSSLTELRQWLLPIYDSSVLEPERNIRAPRFTESSWDIR